MTHGKTYNKSPRRKEHKATKSKTTTGTTALERSVEQITGGFKALLQLANFTLGPDATLNTEIHKKSEQASSLGRMSVYRFVSGAACGFLVFWLQIATDPIALFHQSVCNYKVVIICISTR